MNYETIQSFLNTPVSKLFDNSEAIGQAKDTLKKYECFNELLTGRIDLLRQCEEICSLDLLNRLPTSTDIVDKNFIIGFRTGIKNLLDYYNKYQEAKRFLYEESKKGIN